MNFNVFIILITIAFLGCLLAGFAVASILSVFGAIEWWSMNYLIIALSSGLVIFVFAPKNITWQE